MITAPTMIIAMRAYESCIVAVYLRMLLSKVDVGPVVWIDRIQRISIGGLKAR